MASATTRILPIFYYGVPEEKKLLRFLNKSFGVYLLPVGLSQAEGQEAALTSSLFEVLKAKTVIVTYTERQLWTSAASQHCLQKQRNSR